MTPGESELSLGSVTRADTAALSALFERNEVSCHCRYWHFEGDKNAWLDRCFNAAGDNARELREALAANGELQGVIARSGPQILGWMKLSPARRVQKLYDQRLYKNLPCFGGDRTRVYAIGCFLVDSSARGRGLSHRLLAAGIELAREAGASAIEAFPRRAEMLAAEERWTGPFATFERAGFAIVNDFGPYPVMRLEL